MKRVRIDLITNNLDSRRIPLNSVERSKKESNPMYPYVGANNIQGYIDEYIFDEKILCIAEDGGSWGKGQVCARIFNEKVWVNNHAHVLTAKEEVHLEYLMHYLNWSDLTLYINGATRGKLTQTALNSIQIPLPDLATQKAIAAKLDKADEIRQLNKKLIEQYDALTQSLFFDMFGDPVKNEKGWEVVKINDIAKKEKHSIKAGPFGSSLKKEFYVSEGYKIYGQEQVIKDDLEFGDYYITESKYKELESCKVSENDILISLVGTYGKIAVVPKIFKKGIINPRLMKISPNTEIINTVFIKFQLQGSYVKAQLEKVSRGGTMDIINVGIMKDVKIILPPITLQNEFAERVKAIAAQKALAQQALQQSEDLFNSLLQESFK